MAAAPRPRYRRDRERGLATRAFVARIMRGFQQEMEAMEAGDPPVMHWVETLAKE